MSFLMQENYALFVDVNSHAGQWPQLDGLMVFCANMLIFLWPVLLLFLWGRPLSWRKRPLRPGEAAIVQECRAVVLWTAIACVVAYIFNLSVEYFIFEPRPFITHHVHLLVSHTADASFPSDHTAWSFAVLGMLLFSLPVWMLSAWRQRVAQGNANNTVSLLRPLVLMAIAIVMACSIGIARVFVGVHYPGDVVGGALSGLCAAAIVTFVRHRLHGPTQAVVQFAQRIRLA